MVRRDMIRREYCGQVTSGWEVYGHSKCGRVLCGQTMRCGHTSCEVVVERRKGHSGVGNQEWVSHAFCSDHC
ncbi:hypothetical protein F2Q70_00036414 [Brassica cretica]|uniref:Uncharacterized protein n=1 Tax=Brassica cretica TaxID=69181 RepID=A0A8S9JV88_BRACR|nr:hypothetical protein F2Q70_00036414 [Brassica cretica]